MAIANNQGPCQITPLTPSNRSIDDQALSMNMNSETVGLMSSDVLRKLLNR